jgi:parallel beta-helix repeat protein
MGRADYYCDGTADEVEINAAIDEMDGAGGGLIELTEGTYYTAAAIELADNIMLSGKGWDTIIEKNGNFDGITLTGSDGSEYENVMLRDFKITRNSNDTNAQQLIHLQYVDHVVIQNIWAYQGYDHCCYLEYCDDLIVSSSRFEDSATNAGLAITNAGNNQARTKIIGNDLYNNLTGLVTSFVDYATYTNNTAVGNTNYGFLIGNSDFSSIGNNVAESNGDGGTGEGGFYFGGANGYTITGNVAEDNNPNGFYIASGTKNVVVGNRATNNTTNDFSDSGTNTLYQTATDSDPLNEFT